MLRSALSIEMAAALHNLARAVHYQARYDEAARLYHETLALRRQIDDRRGLAATLNSLGVLNRDRGDDPAARALYEESLALYRDLQDLWGQALLLNNMARITRDANDLPGTHALCVESLDLFSALGDKHGITWVVSNLAIVAERQGAASRAAQLTGATEAVRETLGAAPLSLSPGERAIYEASISHVRAELGAATFASLQAAGRAMSLDEILAFARSDAERPATTADDVPAPVIAKEPKHSPAAPPPHTAAGDRPNPLTRRELQVAALVARGLTNRQIAAELVISEGTVGVHLEHIFGKLELRSRAQLAAWVVERR
jgi:DNA-binding CsgD family transcriptional regulator